jgi:hypothetical protein
VLVLRVAAFFVRMRVLVHRTLVGMAAAPLMVVLSAMGLRFGILLGVTVAALVAARVFVLVIVVLPAMLVFVTVIVSPFAFLAFVLICHIS